MGVCSDAVMLGGISDGEQSEPFPLGKDDSISANATEVTSVIHVRTLATPLWVLVRLFVCRGLQNSTKLRFLVAAGFVR